MNKLVFILVAFAIGCFELPYGGKPARCAKPWSKPTELQIVEHLCFQLS
jgi:hypothetical protein